jgi:hypothetical protein
MSEPDCVDLGKIRHENLPNSSDENLIGEVHLFIH